MMGTILMLSIGAVLSGLVLGIRDLLPFFEARRSGVIVRKGSGHARVRRDEDPDVFSRLLANRSKGATAALGLFMLGLLGVGLSALAFVGFEGPLAIVIFAAYAGFVLFAAFCLIRGFATGHMFAFWSLTLFGGVTRRENAIWFWVYASLNLIIVVSGIAAALQAMAN
jgi:hypothetical protein